VKLRDWFAMSDDAATRPVNARFDGDLRRALLDAAVAVVAVDDPANLSLRAVARKVGVSHAAPKNHFADKTALLTAIAAEGFEGLGQAMADAIGSAASAVDGFLAGGRSYVRFAADHPGHFRVMWRNEILDQDDEYLKAAGEATFDLLVSMVDAAQGEGWAPGRQPDQLAVLAWSSVHGLAQLHLDGPLGNMVGGDLDDLAAKTTELLRHGFGPLP
jgi:AcrR family transcriptional regulator